MSGVKNIEALRLGFVRLFHGNFFLCLTANLQPHLHVALVHCHVIWTTDLKCEQTHLTTRSFCEYVVLVMFYLDRVLIKNYYNAVELVSFFFELILIA